MAQNNLTIKFLDMAPDAGGNRTFEIQEPHLIIGLLQYGPSASPPTFVPVGPKFLPVGGTYRSEMEALIYTAGVTTSTQPQISVIIALLDYVSRRSLAPGMTTPKSWYVDPTTQPGGEFQKLVYITYE